MKAQCCQFLLRVFGFRLKDANLLLAHPRMVVAVAPHTSNWDFFLGLLVRCATKVDVRFLAKQSLFKPPFGFLFRMLGGYPVDRSASSNLTEQIAHIILQHDKFFLSIAPEGTRSRVQQLKSGFYFIAKKAEVPILLVRFDGKNKVVEFGPVFWPSDDPDEDLRKIHTHFRGIEGIRKGRGLV